MVPALRSSQFTALGRIKRLSNFGKKPQKEWEPWNCLGLDPINGLAIQHAVHMGFDPDFSRTRDARFGFTIGGESQLALFLAWKGRLTLWTGKVPKVAKDYEIIHPPIRWDRWVEKEGKMADPKPARVVDTDIKNEQFFAYQDKTHYLFVTESGQVHCLPRDGTDKRTEVIWKDAKRPVRLLLEDNATGTTWAFAPRKDASDNKLSDIYFPLAKTIKPIDFDAKALPAWDLKKPMDMALAHARFLVKQKKVVLEEKKAALPDKK
jgi:hypothetical protein